MFFVASILNFVTYLAGHRSWSSLWQIKEPEKSILLCLIWNRRSCRQSMRRGQTRNSWRKEGKLNFLVFTNPTPVTIEIPVSVIVCYRLTTSIFGFYLLQVWLYLTVQWGKRINLPQALPPLLFLVCYSRPVIPFQSIFNIADMIYWHWFQDISSSRIIYKSSLLLMAFG